MKVSHTPGPWAVVTRQIPGSNDCRPVIVHRDPHPDFDDIAKIVVPDTERNGGRNGALAVANARLISAAPEMLKALLDLRDLANDPAGSTFTLREIFGTFHEKPESEGKAALAAIIKAEGRL